MNTFYEDVEKFEKLAPKGDGPKVINIFDFDGTLFNSPNPNPLIWNHKLVGALKSSYEQGGFGWYQNPLTLDDKYLKDSTFIEHVVKQARKSIDDPNAVTAMLTGRNADYESKVKKLLSDEGLEFDHYGFKPLDTKETTMGFKQRFINELLDEYPTVTEVNMWEDRPKHVAKFKEFLDSKDIDNEVHFVEHLKEFVLKNHREEVDLVNELMKDKRITAMVESINPDNPKYIGVLLDGASHRKLLNELASYIPRDWRKYAHHMTVKLGNKPDEFSDFIDENIGNDFTLTATEIGISNDAIAVKVVSDVPSKNKIPHITIAVPPNGKPVNSNYIANWKRLDNPIQLNGTLAAQY
jgi:hypothetical protein